MLKVGICGAGFTGTMHAACYALIRGVKVAAVGDTRREFAQKLADKYDAVPFPDGKQLIAKANVDIVDICLPTFMHCSHVMLAARRGLHCLCEKPISRTLAEASRIVKAVRSSKIKFMVAHVIRFWPEYQVLKDYLDKKRLGRLCALSLWRVGPRPDLAWKNWYMKPLLSGGAMLDFHIHDADFVRYLLGEPQSLESEGFCRKGLWEYVFTNYRYPDAAVSAYAGWGANDPFEMAFRAVFERGTLNFTSRHEPLTLYQKGKRAIKVKVPQPKVGNVDAGGNISAVGGYYNELKYFVDCLKKGREPDRVTAEDARASLALIFRELASAKKKPKK